MSRDEANCRRVSRKRLVGEGINNEHRHLSSAVVGCGGTHDGLLDDWRSVDSDGKPIHNLGGTQRQVQHRGTTVQHDDSIKLTARRSTAGKREAPISM